MAKPRLLCHITHAPLLESCFPILQRLHDRGRVAVDLVMDRRLLQTIPELQGVFDRATLKPRLQGRLAIEALSYGDIRRADAVLVHTDPKAHPKRSRLRDRYIPWAGTPTIFVQHGLMQFGVNYPFKGQGHHWYSSLMLWWEDFDPVKSSFILDDIRDRIRVVGWIKQAFVPPVRFPDETARFLAGFRKRLLVCTCFPGQEFRFGLENLNATYAMFHEFCARNPDVLLMVRPHRGKQDATGAALDEKLALVPNAVVMNRHSGHFAYATMHDSLSVSDAVVSHASSAVLDAIYDGKPTAVLDNDWPVLGPLPQVRDLTTLERFLADAATIDPRDNAVFRHFGDLDGNLDRACDAIEGFLLSRS